MAVIGSDSETTKLSIDRLLRYVRSPSTRMAAFAALLSYLSYAYAHGSWANPALIGVSVFTGMFMPSYAKLSNKADLWANNQFGFITAGRLGRFIPQYAFNLAVFGIMLFMVPIALLFILLAARLEIVPTSGNPQIVAQGGTGVQLATAPTTTTVARARIDREERPGAPRSRDESAEEKRARKAAAKAERKASRAAQKDVRLSVTAQ